MTSIIYLLLVDILLAVTGQLLLKKAMLILGPIEFSLDNIWPLILSAIKNLYIWVAMCCYVLAMLLWMFVLSKVKLSAAYPMTSLIYVLVVFGSWVFLKESLGIYQVIGTSLVIIGLFFLLKSL